ncbi:MAG: hypothetical protein JJT78_05285 [Leptospira sp.]|nr:hypothetical protein [Leptospira sp.]
MESVVFSSTNIIHSTQKCCFDEKDFEFYYSLFKDIIESHNLSQSPETAVTILAEIVKNAEKANGKKLILENPEKFVEFEKLEKIEDNGQTIYRFNEDVNFHLILKKSIKWIKVIISLEIDEILVQVINNSTLQKNEKYRINQVKGVWKDKNDFLEIFNSLNPKAEMGGGIGLAMSYQLLKSEGILEDNLQISESGDTTICLFRYPAVLKKFKAG